jgi:hypothetical protein
MRSTKSEDLEFQQKARALLDLYEEQFDVKDIFDVSDDL